ncbi:D-tyrosyl-tRNA(Tyr) deacylase [bacterium]|nr:MAG: D-tyrosyl-tRNA(Tyr) deacylase [bacterium]
MRALIQRVLWSKVEVEDIQVSTIGPGLLVFLGVGKDDGPEEADYLARKVSALRIFEDENGRMNRSLLDTKGEALVVSQFTLLADSSSGNRPGFSRAAPAQRAREIYDLFIERMKENGVRTCAGTFRADMKVTLANDGPVTILLESK